VNAKVAEFRQLYEENTGLIAGDVAPGERHTAQAAPIDRPAVQLTPAERQSLVDYVLGLK